MTRRPQAEQREKAPHIARERNGSGEAAPRSNSLLIAAPKLLEQVNAPRYSC
jgi:hypothetical protein